MTQLFYLNTVDDPKTHINSNVRRNIYLDRDRKNNQHLQKSVIFKPIVRKCQTELRRAYTIIRNITYQTKEMKNIKAFRSVYVERW